MAQQVVDISSGSVSSGLTIDDGDDLYVSAGAVVSATTIDGAPYVYGGASDSGAYFADFGDAFATVLVSGGSATVESGGSATFVTVSSGSVLNVASGGVVSGAVVSRYGIEAIVGVTTGDTVLARGEQEVYAGGATTGATIQSGGLTVVHVGGVAMSAVVSAGGALDISAGGIASGTTLAGGNESVYSGAIASGDRIDLGGIETVESGGLATDAWLGGGTQNVFGSADGTMVAAGGQQVVSLGGTATGTTVSSGGQQIVESTGLARGATILDGGQQSVLFGGVAQATSVGAGGLQIVTYAVVSGTAIGNGGQQTIEYAGSADVTTVSAGGLELVLNGGIASGSIVDEGGVVVLLPGAVASGATGPGDVVSTGVVVDQPGGGITAAQTVTGMALGSGATEYVLDQGAADAVTLSNGAVAAVFSGAVASGTVISQGGQEFVFSGGTADGATLAPGAELNLEYDGIFIGALTALSGVSIYASGFSSGQSLVLSSGAAAFDLVVSSGAADVVSQGGTATFTTVQGGAETVHSGGAAISTTVLSGGDQDIQSGGISDSTTVTSGGTQSLETGGGVSGTVLDFGGTLDIEDLTYMSGGRASLDSGDTLTVVEGASSATISLAGNYANDTFQLSADAGGGTDITAEDPPCYCPGTLILTARGEVPVEDLAIGDRVITLSGAFRPVKWIGRRAYAGRFVRGRKDILPIRVARGALDENIPKRDLMVSPRHALYLDGVLIEAADLVNGVSITQAQNVELVTYLHVELDSHDILLAEGAPAESFVDDDNRAMFHNAQEHRTLYPHEGVRPVRYCAPRHRDGHILDAIRRRIDTRAGIMAPAGCNLRLRGYVDFVVADSIAGWAQDPDHPDAPVCLDIVVGGRGVGQTLANRFRPDLACAGMGGGRHGFALALPAGLVATPDNVEVCRALDGNKLPLTEAVLGRRLA